jgi:hypothetical protein
LRIKKRFSRQFGLFEEIERSVRWVFFSNGWHNFPTVSTYIVTRWNKFKQTLKPDSVANAQFWDGMRNVEHPAHRIKDDALHSYSTLCSTLPQTAIEQESVVTFMKLIQFIWIYIQLEWKDRHLGLSWVKLSFWTRVFQSNEHFECWIWDLLSDNYVIVRWSSVLWARNIVVLPKTFLETNCLSVMISCSTSCSRWGWSTFLWLSLLRNEVFIWHVSSGRWPNDGVLINVNLQAFHKKFLESKPRKL